MTVSTRVTSLSAAAKREEYLEEYLDHVCWYCQGIGYLEKIPVKRHGRYLLGPSRVKCLVCGGDGKPRECR
jgi:hypothetical protein